MKGGLKEKGIFCTFFCRATKNLLARLGKRSFCSDSFVWSVMALCIQFHVHQTSLYVYVDSLVSLKFSCLLVSLSYLSWNTAVEPFHVRLVKSLGKWDLHKSEY